MSAPSQEMTDEECWEWLKGTSYSVGWSSTGSIGWCVNAYGQWVVDDGSATQCDAIRAARRKLEGGK